MGLAAQPDANGPPLLLQIVQQARCVGRLLDPGGHPFRIERSQVPEEVVDPIVAFEDLVTEYPKIATDPGSSIKLAATF